MGGPSRDRRPGSSEAIRIALGLNRWARRLDLVDSQIGQQLRDIRPNAPHVFHPRVDYDLHSCKAALLSEMIIPFSIVSTLEHSEFTISI